MRARDAALPALLLLAACGKEAPPVAPTSPSSSSAPAPASPSAAPATPPAAAPAEDHDHTPKHGGTLLEVGEHEAHLEVVHDAAAGTLDAYAYDAEMKPIAVEAPVLNLAAKAVQVAMTPLSGSGTTAEGWRATHAALKGEAPQGRVRLKVGDKTFQVPLEW